MHRGVIEACYPGLITLAVLFLLAWGVARLSGARPRLGRLAELHRCQAGGVQSLSFVITLPVFLIILLFIVQVSQLMIGLITVNYAAYAAARSASVWIPAWVDDQYLEPTSLNPDGSIDERNSQNRLPPYMISPDQPLTLDYQSVRKSGSAKLDEIFHAAALACVPIAPSRDLNSTDQSVLGATRADESMINLYSQLAPPAGSNPRLAPRLRNKLAYSLQNTIVHLTFRDRNSGHDPTADRGPTYNPADDPNPAYPWVPHEVGWQDPVTVEVEHHFALLPGPGRFLSSIVIRPDGQSDTVAPRIFEENGVHKTAIFASATMTIEGLKSVRPYLQRDW